MGLKYSKGELDIKKALAVKIVKQWNRLPRKVVGSPSLEVFEIRLEKQLSGMV